MSILEKLINAYEENEDITVDEVLSSTLKSFPEYAELSKEEIVELKRQFFDYCRDEEKVALFEDKVFFREEARFYEEEAERIGKKEERTSEEAERACKINLASSAGKGIRYSAALPEKLEPRRNTRRPHKKYIEAFINNISVPKTLEELSTYFMNGNHAQGLVDDALGTGTTCWTVPRWAKRGDIVLFMHAKTAKSTLTRLRTEVRTLFEPASFEAKEYEQAIANQLAFYKIYGGKIYAVGRVDGKPERLSVDPLQHFKSNIFCDIDNLFLLDTPIDISEFNSYIEISRMSGITPVFGEKYDQLKSMISEKNIVPKYFIQSYSTPYPHAAVNGENWMKLGLEYRNAFTLEVQFRQCYVDYLLKALGDQKTIYMECACYKGSYPVTFVDNVIRINKKLLPVEVKLNIRLESNLEGQCEQYCMLDKLVLDKKTGREARIKDVISDRVLIIDTYAVYMFYLENKNIKFWYSLDDLKSEEDIRDLRKVVIEKLGCHS